MSNIFDQIKRQTSNVLKTEATKAKNELTKQLQQKINSAINTKKVKVSFTSLPLTLDEFKALPQAKLTNEYDVAALTILALYALKTNKDEGIKILDFLNGPGSINEIDKQFINDRFMDGKDYVIDSYFDGTSPNDNYEHSDNCSITIIEQSNSRAEEGYIRLYIQSSGADSLRQVTLRKKPSTNQWFLWNYKMLLTDIIKPKKLDEWA